MSKIVTHNTNAINITTYMGICEYQYFVMQNSVYLGCHGQMSYRMSSL
jgi:hypothetical protein